jgi:serine protease Do
VVERASPAFVFIGGGSGVVITPDGEFLTNQHVALSSQRWEVRLADGRVVTAKRLGSDPYGDVALLKIEGVEKLACVPFGDSDALRPGEPVVALGNPFALGGVLGGQRGDPAVSAGVVSATHRRQGTYMDAIQTDAAINPGNSGGPLLNLRGELVGINGRIATRFGNRVNSGVGFAIPVNQIRRFLPAFRAGGTAFHGMIEGLQVDRRYHDEAGARVTGVVPGSPAARAGFALGDVVTGVDRYPTPTWSRMAGIVASFPEGADLDVAVRRGDGERRLPVRLSRLRDREAEIRFVAQTAPTELGVRVDDAPAGGVVLVEVTPGSPAASAGLKTDDILVAFNGRRVEGRLDYFMGLRWTRPGQRVALELRRGGETVRAEVALRARVRDTGEEGGTGEEEEEE